MRVLIGIALLTLFIYSFTGTEEDKYPKDDFRAPVGTPVRLSGTFGELRPNHFHAGIDIKGKVGDPLYAIADGYVSRISISGNGYGRAIYLTHPNGYTSLYAHTAYFSPEIERFVKNYQTKKQRYEVDIELGPEKIPVVKGQLIGAIGLTGSTAGPHLHFEIHETKTNDPVNPLLFGFGVPDTRPPRMQELKVYHLSENREELDHQTRRLIGGGNNYFIQGDTIAVNTKYVGFGLEVHDRMNDVYNRNGIYAMDVYLEDSLIFQFEMERFPEEDTRYLNAHLDYREFAVGRNYFNRSYTLPGNQLPIYSKLINDGVIQLPDNKSRKIDLVARDLAGNQARLTFWVKRTSEAPVLHKRAKYNYLLPANEESIISNYEMQLHFPKTTFYEDIYLQYEITEDLSEGVYSNVHHLHNTLTPVHEYFDIAIRPHGLPEVHRGKAFVAHCSDYNRVINCGGSWDEDGRLQAQVRILGDYCIMVDTVPPGIKAIRFPYNLKSATHVTFKIWDNFRTGRNVDNLQYDGYIDGEWVLMVYDAKYATVRHYFEKDLPSGKHDFRLVVTDALGNQTVFEQEFLR